MAVIYQQRRDDEKLATRIKVAGCMIFFAFFAFRGYIWHDWTLYYKDFSDCSWYDFAHYDYAKSREPGWLLLELSLKSVYDEYLLLVFTVSTIQFVLLYRFLNRYTGNVLFGLAAYLCFGGFEMSINLMRNATAILIFLNALHYIHERKLIRYILMCVLAASIHISSVMFLPLYFLLRFRTNKWVFIGVIIVAHLVLFSHVSILFTIIKMLGVTNDAINAKIETYMDLGTFGSSRFVILQRIIISTLIVCYYNKLRNLREDSALFLNGFMYYIAIQYLTSEFSEISLRLSMLFTFSIWILWGDLFKCFNIPNNRYLFTGFTLFFFLFAAATDTKEKIKEYQNFLFGNADSYEERLYNFNKYFEEPDQVKQDK